MAVIPHYRVIGDYWSFTVQFKDPGTGAAVPIVAGLAPGAEFFSAYAAAPALDLTTDNGRVTILDAANGIVAYVIEASATLGALPQSASQQAFLPGNYPTRLQCFLTDSQGRQTYAIVGIVPIDPRSTRLDIMPPATSIVASAGPAGAPGPGLITGSGSPGSSLGSNGQIYIDLASRALYYHASSVWTLIGYLSAAAASITGGQTDFSQAANSGLIAALCG